MQFYLSNASRIKSLAIIINFKPYTGISLAIYLFIFYLSKKILLCSTSMLRAVSHRTNFRYVQNFLLSLLRERKIFRVVRHHINVSFMSHGIQLLPIYFFFLWQPKLSFFIHLCFIFLKTFLDSNNIVIVSSFI